MGGSPPPLPEASPELRHLLSRLLARNPAERCCWADLCAHPFWGATPPVLVVGPEAEAELQACLYQWLQLHGLPPGGRAVSPPKMHLRISATGSSDLSGSASRARAGASLSESLTPDAAAGDMAGPTPVHPRVQQLAAPPSVVAAAARNGASAVAPQFLDFSSVADALERPPPPRGSKLGQRQAAAPPRPQPSPPSPLPLSALIWHPSEAAMKPIVGNRR